MPPFYLSKATDWTLGNLDPITFDEWLGIVLADDDLTMELHRQTAADKSDRVFTYLALSPAYLRSEPTLKSSSFLTMDLGCVVAMSPTVALTRKMESLSRSHGFTMTDASFLAVDLAAYERSLPFLDLSTFEWLAQGVAPVDLDRYPMLQGLTAAKEGTCVLSLGGTRP